LKAFIVYRKNCCSEGILTRKERGSHSKYRIFRSDEIRDIFYDRSCVEY